MLSAVLFAACTPSEEDSPAPTFPDPVEGVFDLEAEGGNIKTITFNANYKWTVSIPAESSTEFGILTEEGDVLTSLSGPAGEGSVQIVCLLDYQDLEEHSVVVSMTMESETREIASFVLYSSTPVFKFRMAEFKDGDYTQSTDEESAFEHVFVDLPSDGKVPMVWSAAEAGYIAYVQVEANFDTQIPNSGLSVYENASSGRFTEYKLVCNTVNYDKADGVGYTFTVNSKTENYEENNCALLAPQFEPLLEVRKAVVGEEGNFQYGDVYNWVYEDEPLEQSSQIDLVYRPNFNNAIDMYLLVKSNFPATVSGPKWLAVADPQAQTTSTDYVLENVYQISADPATMTLAQETGNLSFGFGTYSVSYVVAHEDYSDLFTIDHYEVPTFNFDIAGEFAAQEMGSQEATVGLVSSGDLDFYIFNKTPYGNYQSRNADWVTTEYSWQTGTETVAAPVIQNNTLTIDAAANDGEDPREAIVVAYPKAKASEVEEWPAPEYFFLNDYQNGLKDEYAKYLCAYVTQDGQAEPVEAAGLDDMWTAMQWDGLIASSLSIPYGVTGNTAAKPWLVSMSSPMQPAMAITGIPSAEARFRTAEGTFPMVVCLSILPSPVITRSAPAARLSKPTASSIISDPGTSLAPRYAARAPPSPPAAPAPFIVLMSCPHTFRVISANDSMPLSRSLTVSGPAPPRRSTGGAPGPDTAGTGRPPSGRCGRRTSRRRSGRSPQTPRRPHSVPRGYGAGPAGPCTPASPPAAPEAAPSPSDRFLPVVSP